MGDRRLRESGVRNSEMCSLQSAELPGLRRRKGGGRSRWLRRCGERSVKHRDTAASRALPLPTTRKGAGGNRWFYTVAALRFPALFGPPIAPRPRNRISALRAAAARRLRSETRLRTQSLHPPLAALRRFPQFVRLWRTKEFQSFSPRRVRGENTLTQPPLGRRPPVTASGAPQKRIFCGGRRNKRSGVRFCRRRDRIKRSLFRRGEGE